MKKAAKLVFDQEAFNAPQPERVTRRKLMNGRYAMISFPKLQPGEKRKDPIGELMRLRDEILAEEAEKAATQRAKNDGHREAA